MHELSIAKSLLERALAHVPRQSRLRELHVLVGPLQAIDPTALRWSWDSITRNTSHAGAIVAIRHAPWTLRCRLCGQQFQSADFEAACPCGSTLTTPVGGDELILDSIDVEYELPGPVANGGLICKCK